MEVVIAAGIMGIIGVGMVSLTRNEMATSIKSQVDLDFTKTISAISTLMANPSACNANFSNRANSGTLPAIYSCVGANVNCKKTGAGANTGTDTVVFPVVAGTAALDANWTAAVTKISNRIRIKSIDYVANSVTGTAISTLTLTVKFVMRDRPDKVDTATNLLVPVPRGLSATPATAEIVKVFSVPVVMTASTILGCPKSWNSTLHYGVP